MAKKESGKKRFRLPLFLFVLALVGTGLWFWEGSEEWKGHLYSYVENGEILTLESKFTPDQIMDSHRSELLGTSGKRTYQEPINKYYPYLLLEVKYTEDKKSREGFLIWGLTNGEMVINTETWETTHGFKDCLDCKASRNDFKILQTLARQGGSLPIESLQKNLQMDREQLDPLIDEAKNKHLIVQKGNLIQLHFENPKLLVIPQTKIKQHLVSKPIQSIQKEPKAYSRNQIIKIAKAAFGEDFTIRNEREIYLPVFSIGVLNQDGTIHLSDWNALTGQRIKTNTLIH